MGISRGGWCDLEARMVAVLFVQMIESDSRVGRRPGISGRGFRTAVFTFNLIQMPWIKKTGALASEVLMILFWRSF